jgi:hypothetical protein
MCHVCALAVLTLLGTTPVAKGQAGAPVAVAGDDFRIDNTVYAGDQKEPPCESTTIFHGGAVFDCMKTPAETIVFEPSAGRFVLLNLKQRTRTELTTAELGAFSHQLQHDAAASSDPLVRFLAAPKFEVRFDRAGNEMTLSSMWVNYRLTLVPAEDPVMVERYREFCDWSARLNALLSPSSRPPFGRLAVNAELAQRKATASEVVLTLSSPKRSSSREQNTIRSEHRLARPLDAADLDRVADAHRQMTSFKLVGFAQYRKSELR